MGITRRRIKEGYVTKNTLVWAVEDILQLGLNKKSQWPVKSIEVVDAILEAVKIGLKRDGFVTIPGLGTFKVTTRKPKWQYTRNRFTGELGYKVLPAKNIVRFKLSKAGKAFVDAGVKEDVES